MKKEILVSGNFVSRFKIPKKDIDDLNNRYEKAKAHLNSYGSKLAGHII